MKLTVNDNGIDRQMNAAEQSAHEQFLADEAQRIAAQVAALEATAAAKVSASDKLKALGLTDDEIAALVG